MTEDEKQARKLRRVMANRESARRTIRRRQALYEALTRKAADLAWENDKLKKDKEAAWEEHRSLQCTNRNLKEQIAERLRERRPHREVSASGDTVDVSTFVTEEQQFACGKPSLPSFMLRSRFCLPNVNLSQVDAYGMSDAAVNPLPHETYAVADFVSSPWCFPWLVPRDKHSLWLPFDMKPGASTRTEPNLMNSGNNTSLVSSQNGGGPLIGFQSKIAVDSALGTIRGGGDAEASSSACVAGFHHESSMNLGRKLIDSAAAVEARKKRKELTKLKNLHHGTSRVHYGHSPG